MTLTVRSIAAIPAGPNPEQSLSRSITSSLRIEDNSHWASGLSSMALRVNGRCACECFQNLRLGGQSSASRSGQVCLGTPLRVTAFIAQLALA